MDFLQLTLISNAIFSSVTGLGLIFFHHGVSQYFGRQQSTPFWIIGIGLVGFAFSLYLLAQNPEPDQVWSIIFSDVLWVLASLAILIFKPFGLSAKGHRIIGGIALIVLLFAIAQFLGLR